MKTKENLIVISTALVLAGCDFKTKTPAPETLKEVSPVTPHLVGNLDPGDIGIFKYVFEATPRAGKVMVLRWTKFVPGQQPEVRETISVNTNGPVREVVLIYNPSLFPFNPEPDKPGRVVVKAPGGEYRLPAGVTCTDVRADDEPLGLHFSNNERWLYQCFIEDYKTVKARIPNLPAAPTNGGWSFNSNVVAN